MSNGAMVTGSESEPSSELEDLIHEQLRIMAKQIEVLRFAPASTLPERNGASGHE
jgi:hypothetical protein